MMGKIILSSTVCALNTSNTKDIIQKQKYLFQIQQFISCGKIWVNKRKHNSSSLSKELRNKILKS